MVNQISFIVLSLQEVCLIKWRQKSVAQCMVQVFSWQNPPEWFQALQQQSHFVGYGKTSVPKFQTQIAKNLGDVAMLIFSVKTD